jgi:hypothetical protein
MHLGLLLLGQRVLAAVLQVAMQSMVGVGLLLCLQLLRWALS